VSRSLSEIFEGFTGKDDLALYDHMSRVTFDELYRRSRVAAAQLQMRGVERGDRVILFADKSPEAISILFGCMLIGAAFCPLDWTLPTARLASMLSDLCAKIVVMSRRVDPNSIESAYEYSGQKAADWFYVNELLVGGEDGDLGSSFPPEETAYVIFTSGSTGEPKGVEISQENLSAFLSNFGSQYGETSRWNYLSMGPLFFDMTVLDCLVPLTYGRPVYLYNQPLVPRLFASAIERHEIDCLSAVPSVLSHLIDSGGPDFVSSLSHLRMILFGAEPIGKQLASCLLRENSNLRLINAYGPTEASVCCFSFEFGLKEVEVLVEYPIGRPFEGVLWRIRTGTDAWSTSGTGTLHVGGKQVMRGYLNRPQQTAERLETIDGCRYYNTGDIVYIDESGLTFFRGREDDEVKVKGHRIHLLDVVNTIERATSLGPVSVSKSVLGGDDCLSIVFEGRKNFDLAIVIETLRRALPLHMIPRVWVSTCKLPTLPNGKVSRSGVRELVARAISSLDTSNLGTHFIVLQGKFECASSEQS
jgi:amino acid adenylation domain-containing protein